MALYLGDERVQVNLDGSPYDVRAFFGFKWNKYKATVDYYVSGDLPTDLPQVWIDEYAPVYISLSFSEKTGFSGQRESIMGNYTSYGDDISNYGYCIVDQGEYLLSVRFNKQVGKIQPLAIAYKVFKKSGSVLNTYLTKAGELPEVGFNGIVPQRGGEISDSYYVTDLSVLYGVHDFYYYERV